MQALGDGSDSQRVESKGEEPGHGWLAVPIGDPRPAQQLAVVREATKTLDITLASGR